MLLHQELQDFHRRNLLQREVLVIVFGNEAAERVDQVGQRMPFIAGTGIEQLIQRGDCAVIVVVGTNRPQRDEGRQGRKVRGDVVHRPLVHHSVPPFMPFHSGVNCMEIPNMSSTRPSV